MESPWMSLIACMSNHDDVIEWKHFPRYWPFVGGIHRSSVNSPQKGQWRGASMLSLVCTWINGWVNNRQPGDSRRHCAHYDITVMFVGFSKRCHTNIPSVSIYIVKSVTDIYLNEVVVFTHSNSILFQLSTLFQYSIVSKMCWYLTCL